MIENVNISPVIIENIIVTKGPVSLTALWNRNYKITLFFFESDKIKSVQI